MGAGNLAPCLEVSGRRLRSCILWKVSNGDAEPRDLYRIARDHRGAKRPRTNPARPTPERRVAQERKCLRNQLNDVGCPTSYCFSRGKTPLPIVTRCVVMPRDQELPQSRFRAAVPTGTLAQTAP